MNFTGSFIAWILVVQMGTGEVRIPFNSYGLFNSKKCVEWEAVYRAEGLKAECKPND